VHPLTPESRKSGVRRETVARKRLGKQILAATNTRAATEESVASAFSVRSVLNQIIYSERKTGDYFFPELLVL
jgi:hypothetical protein